MNKTDQTPARKKSSPNSVLSRPANLKLAAARLKTRNRPPKARLRKTPLIQEVVREPTAGGVIFRPTKDGHDIEILLIQDSKKRWTIPKGHIEPGETAKKTAIREIGEETGLFKIAVLDWLGKIHFKYRRMNKIVLMTTQIYLVESLDPQEKPTKEKWMTDIRWFSFAEALNLIEYSDIEKLILLAKRKIRQGVISHDR